MVDPGTLKQEIMRVNNRVNQALFGNGLRWQKVDIAGDRIVILAENRRVKPLAAIDESAGYATRAIDLALLDEYKVRLRQELEQCLNIKVRSILKDYDPKHQLAGTIIVTEEALVTAGPDTEESSV